MEVNRREQSVLNIIYCLCLILEWVQETHLNGLFWIPTYGQINIRMMNHNGKNTSWTPGESHLPRLSIYHEWAF